MPYCVLHFIFEKKKRQNCSKKPTSKVISKLNFTFYNESKKKCIHTHTHTPEHEHKHNSFQPNRIKLLRSTMNGGGVCRTFHLFLLQFLLSLLLFGVRVCVSRLVCMNCIILSDDCVSKLRMSWRIFSGFFLFFFRVS